MRNVLGPRPFRSQLPAGAPASPSSSSPSTSLFPSSSPKPSPISSSPPRKPVYSSTKLNSVPSQSQPSIAPSSPSSSSSRPTSSASTPVVTKQQKQQQPPSEAPSLTLARLHSTRQQLETSRPRPSTLAEFLIQLGHKSFVQKETETCCNSQSAECVLELLSLIFDLNKYCSAVLDDDKEELTPQPTPTPPAEAVIATGDGQESQPLSFSRVTSHALEYLRIASALPSSGLVDLSSSILEGNHLSKLTQTLYSVLRANQNSGSISGDTLWTTLSNCFSLSKSTKNPFNASSIRKYIFQTLLLLSSSASSSSSSSSSSASLSIPLTSLLTFASLCLADDSSDTVFVNHVSNLLRDSVTTKQMADYVSQVGAVKGLNRVADWSDDVLARCTAMEALFQISYVATRVPAIASDLKSIVYSATQELKGEEQEQEQQQQLLFGQEAAASAEAPSTDGLLGRMLSLMSYNPTYKKDLLTILQRMVDVDIGRSILYIAKEATHLVSSRTITAPRLSLLVAIGIASSAAAAAQQPLETEAEYYKVLLAAHASSDPLDFFPEELADKTVPYLPMILDAGRRNRISMPIQSDIAVILSAIYSSRFHTAFQTQAVTTIPSPLLQYLSSSSASAESVLSLKKPEDESLSSMAEFEAFVRMFGRHDGFRSCAFSPCFIAPSDSRSSSPDATTPMCDQLLVRSVSQALYLNVLTREDAVQLWLDLPSFVLSSPRRVIFEHLRKSLSNHELAIASLEKALHDKSQSQEAHAVFAAYGLESCIRDLPFSERYNLQKSGMMAHRLVELLMPSRGLSERVSESIQRALVMLEPKIVTRMRFTELHDMEALLLNSEAVSAHDLEELVDVSTAGRRLCLQQLSISSLVKVLFARSTVLDFVAACLAELARRCPESSDALMTILNAEAYNWLTKMKDLLTLKEVKTHAAFLTSMDQLAEKCPTLAIALGIKEKSGRQALRPSEHSVEGSLSLREQLRQVLQLEKQMSLSPSSM